MSTELQTAMTRLVDKLNTAGDFAIEHAPEILQQFILWERVSAIMWLVTAGLLGFFGLYRNIHKFRSLSVHNDDEGEMIFRTLVAVSATILCLGALGSGFTKLSSFITPEYHIVKQFL